LDTKVFVALFTIAKQPKKPRCAMNELMNVIYTHKHTHRGILFSHKKNEIMSLTGKWMELEIIMLNDES
jgi:hypothetical protein